MKLKDFEIERSNLSEIFKFKKWIEKYLPYLKRKMTEDYLNRKIKMANKGELIKVVFKGKPIGFLVWLEEIDKSAYLWLEIVLPKYRSQGIGSFLIDEALKSIEKLGYDRVWTKVKNDNHLMLITLFKRGFYIKGNINEKGLVVIFLEKIF